MRKIYIAGPISKDKDFYEKFRKVELKLKRQGNIVLNPAKLPPGMEQQEYMSICIPMLYVCDEIFMLKGWDNSVGACIEHDIAQQSGIKIRYQDFS